MKTYIFGMVATVAYALAVAANGVWRFVPDNIEGAFLLGGGLCAVVVVVGGVLAMWEVMREANESGKEG